MSTRSRIGYSQTKADQPLTVSCHYDGYLSGVGAILLEHFNNAGRAAGLIALGDLQSLNQDGTAIAYHRDRGEGLDENSPEIGWPSDGDQEFQYWFTNSMWLYMDGRKGEWKPLTVKDVL